MIDKTDETIDRAHRVLRELEDLNSSFPATQEFLHARGLNNVRELDRKGKLELQEYLSQVLQQYRAADFDSLREGPIN